MGLFGPSKADKAAAAAREQLIEQQAAQQAAADAAFRAEVAARVANDHSLQAPDEKRFRAEFVQWLDSMKAYQESTHAASLTDELVVSEMVMPLPSSKGMSRLGAAGYLAGMRTWANIWAKEYEVNATVAAGQGAMSFWQDVTEYVEGALLQPGL